MDELFDLEELVGPMGIGLSSEQILKHLKMGTHISSIDQLSSDEEPEICVICQVCNTILGLIRSSYASTSRST
ncbi:RING-type E3 ubiquitin transferase [Sarracenia purpurea var. burkii]